MSVLEADVQIPEIPSSARKPMRILLLPSSYAPVLGGLQTVAQALARNLMARGHEVRVVTNRYPRNLPSRETIDGVSVERWQFLRPSWDQLRRRRADLFLAALYYAPTVRHRLHRLMRTFRPDVVNVHFPDALIPFVLGLRRHFSFRLVVSLHGHDVERFTAPGAKKGESWNLRAILREADAVTACSRHLLETADRLEPSVQAKGFVLYNGIDPERFRDRTPYQHPRPYIFAMGRLTHQKGFDLLLEAFARVNPLASNVDLILAGEGEERTALESQAQQLGLGERVYFYGRASQEEIVRLLNGCLFLAVPSRLEPFGIVAMEGLAAGKPVLATRVGGMGEFLAPLASSLPSLPAEAEQDGGVDITLVEPTVDELAEGLRTRFASRIGVRQEPQIIARVRNEYSWAEVARRYEDVLAV